MVPFWVCSGVLVKDDNMLPRTELHRRFRVASFSGCRSMTESSVGV